ncbi:hypothetical protein SAMN05421639_101925 [Chryseobacterium shigense]|uniref:Uncharacterized protein n=1 Tax=Chryseobacterium shigense TaxID=297244 RepID=A0A1N7I057_9FLAO|nr:hypothetical protein SAMN05421639_101925 [Chryseobacterium shigense]
MRYIICLGIFISNMILNGLIMMLMAKILNYDGADFGMIPIEILMPSGIAILGSFIIFLLINPFRKLNIITSIYIYNGVYFFSLLNMGLNVSAKDKSGINNDLYLLISLILSFLIILIAANLITKQDKQSEI